MLTKGYFSLQVSAGRKNNVDKGFYIVKLWKEHVMYSTWKTSVIQNMQDLWVLSDLLWMP